MVLPHKLHHPVPFPLIGGHRSWVGAGCLFPQLFLTRIQMLAQLAWRILPFGPPSQPPLPPGMHRRFPAQSSVRSSVHPFNPIFSQPKRGSLAYMCIRAQEEIGEELRKIPAIRHLAHKSTQAHPGLLPVGIPLPVHPTQIACYRLDCSGLLHELSPLGRELSAAVEIVKQCNAARKVAEEHMELAVCGELIFVLDARGGEK